MLASKTVNTNQGVIDAIEGAVVAEGNLGTNTAVSANFSDATSLAFADVEAGDALYISGVLSPYTVQSKTDDNHLVMTGTIATAHSASATWKAKRGGIGIAAMAWDPIKDPKVEGKWHLFYNTATFTVT